MSDRIVVVSVPMLRDFDLTLLFVALNCQDGSPDSTEI